MKKLVLVIIVFLSVFMLTGCNKETDALKFKNEYESLNGTTSSSGKTIREISINEDNPIIYKTAEEIVEMINNKETFVVYFGFAKCPWCRSVLPTLLEVSEDLKLDKLFYVDVLEIRDTLEVKDNKVVTKTEGSEGYYKLLELLDSVLDEYSLSDSDGKKVQANEKRIYAPNVVAVIEGQAERMTTGISSSQNDAYMDLTEEMINETYNKFKCIIECVIDSQSSCPLNNKC